MIKGFNIFENNLENRKNKWIGDIEKSHKIEETIIDNVDILDYVRFFHNYDDEINDDFYERIVENNDYFILKWVNINDIKNLNDFFIDEFKINEYVELYKKNKNYPPPVLDYNYYIIDGTHRIHALKELNYDKIKCYVGQKNLFENYTLKDRYLEIFGVPKTKQQEEHMKKWIEKMSKNKDNYNLKNSEEEVKRMAFAGEQDPFYRTMENTYKDAPEYKDQNLLDFYKSKNKIKTKEDIDKMLSWYRQQKKAKNKTPEPNYYGKEQQQIPSNKDNSNQSNMTGSGCR